MPGFLSSRPNLVPPPLTRKRVLLYPSPFWGQEGDALACGGDPIQIKGVEEQTLRYSMYCILYYNHAVYPNPFFISGEIPFFEFFLMPSNKAGKNPAKSEFDFMHIGIAFWPLYLGQQYPEKRCALCISTILRFNNLLYTYTGYLSFLMTFYSLF